MSNKRDTTMFLHIVKIRHQHKSENVGPINLTHISLHSLWHPDIALHWHVTSSIYARDSAQGSLAGMTIGATSDTANSLLSSKPKEWLALFLHETLWHTSTTFAISIQIYLGSCLQNAICRLVLVYIQALLPSTNQSFFVFVELVLSIIGDFFFAQGSNATAM